ncbi:MAG TPA: RNA polymerase sigma factor RpoD/SigA [Treponemataceae bacterium]|nr:RNA polymerase sigma factor RpoD/SigA [Treponemataceae bacterium]
MSDYDSISEYLKEIRKYPLLSFQEEIDLSHRVQEGDLSAHKKLIESNLRLVVTIARKYAAPDMPLLDIIQEGNLGLITAAQKYEFSYNVRFSTYACWWIQQAITRAIANKRRIIRLPFRKEELAGRIRRVSSELYQRFSRMPSNEEIAVALNISVQEVTNIMLCAGSVTSLDVQLEDEDSVSLKDIIPDSTYNPEEMFMKKYTHDCMLEVMSDLKETERDILVKRYNLQNDGSNYTLKSIGNQYGVSAETIRQVELRALRKLKLKSEELKELAYC